MNNPRTCYNNFQESLAEFAAALANLAQVFDANMLDIVAENIQHASDNPAKKVTVPFQNTYGESWQSVENHSGIIRRIRMRKAREPPASYYKNTLNSCVGLHSN